MVHAIAELANVRNLTGGPDASPHKRHGGILVWRSGGLHTWLLVLLLGLACGAASRAQDKDLSPDSTLSGVLERGKLRVCFEAGYMPFEMVGTRSGLRERRLRPADERKGAQTTRFGGFDIDLGREMARELGVNLVPVNTRWTSIIPSLVLGRCDVIISGMSITEERRAKVDFSDPYMKIGQTVLLNRKLDGEITSWRDLDDGKYAISSKPGTTGEEAVMRLLPKARYHPFESEAQAAAAVVQGTVDAFVYDHPYHATFIAMHGDEAVVFLDEPFTDEALAFAIRKDDWDFLAWLNGFLERLNADGRYEQIRSKWLESTDWFSHYR